MYVLSKNHKAYLSEQYFFLSIHTYTTLIPRPNPILTSIMNAPIIFLVQVPSPEMANKTLTGTHDSHYDGVKECKGWFSQNLPWEELRDGQESVVSCIGKGN